MQKYDVIIVGSGLGGLLCGFILSKFGYKVQILEKNDQIGGCLQTFSRQGVPFDTGMHYIGSYEEGQILHKFFKFFELNDKIKVKKLNEDGFDVIHFKDKEYKFAMGYEGFLESLINQFPNEREPLKNYVKKLKEISCASPLYNLEEINSQTIIETEYVKTSVNNFIDSITTNPILRQVLAGNNPLYAGVSNKTPLYIHALINNFYIQSAWRIVDGSSQIANQLKANIEKEGGSVRTLAQVKQFVFDNNTLKSVELTDGEKIEAKYFISNIHPEKTLEMLDTPLIRNVYRSRIKSLDNTISNFTVYITFKKNTFPYLNYNLYYYKNDNVWDSSDYTSNDWPRNILFMNQARADEGKYADSALAIAYMKMEDVKQWENTFVGKRGADYLEFKKIKAEKILNQLEKIYPGIKNNIQSYYTSSPLTYRDYTGTKDGSMYGILRDCNSPTQTLVSQRTKIPNLFLTGQNVNSHGILGVTIGAILTCAELLGINTIIKKINEV